MTWFPLMRCVSTVPMLGVGLGRRRFLCWCPFALSVRPLQLTSIVTAFRGVLPRPTLRTVPSVSRISVSSASVCACYVYESGSGGVGFGMSGGGFFYVSMSVAVSVGGGCYEVAYESLGVY